MRIRLTFQKNAAAVLVAGIAAASLPALAADPITDTWKLRKSDIGAGGVNGGVSALSNNYTYESEAFGHKVNVSGWYTSDWGNNWQNESEYLTHWNNGVSLSRPNESHTTDNSGGYEFVLFEFEKPVSLQNFKYGYVNSDSDTSIMFYDDVLAGSNSVSGEAFGDKGAASIDTSGTPSNTKLKFDSSNDSLTKRGFSLLDGGGSQDGRFSDGATAFADPGTGQTATTVGQNTGSAVFSYLWAIGADFFETGSIDGGKIKRFTATWHEEPSTEASVPVPASAALLALGLVLLRRKSVY